MIALRDQLPLAGLRLIDAYVDWLWFGELGYCSVFTTMLATRIVVCLAAGVVVGGIVFGGLALAYRTRPVPMRQRSGCTVSRRRAGTPAASRASESLRRRLRWPAEAAHENVHSLLIDETSR